MAAEQAKRQLSMTENTNINIESLYDVIDLQCTMNRDRFRIFSTAIINQAVEVVVKFLENRNIPSEVMRLFL